MQASEHALLRTRAVAGEEGELLDELDIKRYLAVRDSVMSVTEVNRYDIMHGATQLARAMSMVSKALIDAAQNLLRYRFDGFHNRIQGRELQTPSVFGWQLRQ